MMEAFPTINEASMAVILGASFTIMAASRGSRGCGQRVGIG